MPKKHLEKKLDVLAIDSEYLIGLDVERILGDAFACSVTVLTPKLFADVAPRRHFDVAVLGGSDNLSELAATVKGVKDIASHLVLSISDREYLAGVPGFENIPVVMKPFDDQMLANTVSSVVG